MAGGLHACSATEAVKGRDRRAVEDGYLNPCRLRHESVWLQLPNLGICGDVVQLVAVPSLEFPARLHQSCVDCWWRGRAAVKRFELQVPGTSSGGTYLAIVAQERAWLLTQRRATCFLCG